MFKPLHDNILVRRMAEPEKTLGGIYIPDASKEKPAEGVIVSTGYGRVVDGAIKPLAVKAGDRVLFGKYGGTEVTIDGEELLILRETDVLGVLS